MQHAPYAAACTWRNEKKHRFALLHRIMTADNLSKKKQKALLFRKGKDEREAEKQSKAERKKAAGVLLAGEQESPRESGSESTKTALLKLGGPQEASPAVLEEHLEPQTTSKKRLLEDDEAPKKRKTRRGKKGKGVNNGAGPRYILFIGNLPYNTTQAELEHHFQKCRMDRIRLRREKGIAFLEFDNDNGNIKGKMDVALAMHHSMFRNRKINVELTVGGGGNSEARVTKLKEKNNKLGDERRQRAKKLDAKKALKDGEKARTSADEATPTPGMHPARAALLTL